MKGVETSPLGTSVHKSCKVEVNTTHYRYECVLILPTDSICENTKRKKRKYDF